MVVRIRRFSFAAMMQGNGSSNVQFQLPGEITRTIARLKFAAWRKVYSQAQWKPFQA